MLKTLKRNLTGTFFILKCNMQQKTIEIYTCVSNKDLSGMPNPLDLIYGVKKRQGIMNSRDLGDGLRKLRQIRYSLMKWVSPLILKNLDYKLIKPLI